MGSAEDARKTSALWDVGRLLFSRIAQPLRRRSDGAKLPQENAAGGSLDRLKLPGVEDH